MYKVIHDSSTVNDSPSFFRSVFLYGDEGIPMQGTTVINRFVNFPSDQLLIWLMHHENRNLTRIDGVTLPLYGDWSDNFWHWTYEALPVALAAHQGGFSGTYLVPDIPFAADSLKLLGIRPDQIRSVKGDDYFLECMCLPGKCRGNSPSTFAALVQIREIIRSQFATANPAHRLYVSRNAHHDSKRKVVNDSELSSLLERFGFQMLHLEQLSLEEQLAFTCNAQSLVGPHGAGMTHCTFMPRGSVVLELFAPTYVNPCNLSACQEFRHRYFQITSPCNHDGYQHGDDIDAYLQIVELTLERELAPR